MADFLYPNPSSSSNPSVGTNGTTAPSSSNEIGFIDGTGKLQGVSGTNPLPVTIGGGLANPLPVADAAAEASLATIVTNTTGVATAANQTTEITKLTAINTAQTNASQKTQIVDGSGHVISSLADGNGGYAIEVSQSATGFQYDSSNSSSAQLAASATFTGGITQVINQQSYSILLTSDQNGTLTLNQFIDAGGVHLAQQLVYTITAGQGFARSGVMNGDYFQLKFQNTGGSTTTTLTIDTYYGTIPSSTQLNNAPVAINEINGTAITGSTLPVSASFVDVTASGNITSTQSITIATAGCSTVGFQATGTWTGSIVIEATVDNVNWLSTTFVALTSGGIASSFSANTIGQISCSGLVSVRLRGNTVATGTAVITMRATPAESNMMLDNPIPAGTNTIGAVNQGTANTAANGWFVKTTDGTNTSAVKAASTAPVATDPALVVTMSPNSADPAIGPVSPGTAAAKSYLVGGVYNSSGVALTNGQQASAQMDQFGNIDIVHPDLIVTGQSAQTATVNNILTATAGSAATNAANYKSALVQVTSTGTGGTFIFEGSNDNVNFQTIPVWNQLVLTGTPITAAITASASQIGYIFPIQFQYIRLRIATTITGGSIQAFSRFTQAAWTPGIFQVAQATAANLNVTAGAGSALIGYTTAAGQSGNTNANTSVASTALEASHVLKASAGRLYQLVGVNTATTAQYIQIFNSATVPADTTVPVLLAYVPAGGNFSWDFGPIGRYFATGISVSNSSTAATKTIGSANCWFNAEVL